MRRALLILTVAQASGLWMAWPAAAQVRIAVSAEPPLPVPNLMANAQFEAGDARAPEGWGARDLVELMPVLHELLSEGWQADAGFTTDQRLWTARYGTGVHGFLVVGNPTRETIAAALTRTGNALYCAYDGEERTVHRADDGSLSISLPDLGPHEHAILRAAVVIGQSDWSLGKPFTIAEGRASMQLDGLTGGSLQAQWTGAPRNSVVITARIPRGATPISFVLNGEAREFEALDGAVR